MTQILMEFYAKVEILQVFWCKFACGLPGQGGDHGVGLPVSWTNHGPPCRNPGDYLYDPFSVSCCVLGHFSHV